MVRDKIYINGFSIVAPGLVVAEDSIAILQGIKQWHEEPLPKLVPTRLPKNERRRTTLAIRIALETIQSLLRVDDDLDNTATVFASSDGDLSIDDKICEALAKQEKIVSPTQFHNSVHNAPAGYWAIAAAMTAESVSLSSGNATFAAGLVEAVTQVVTTKQNVLLVAYDVVAPEKLDAVRHFEYSIGIALRLGVKSESGSLGYIRLSMNNSDAEITTCKNISLEPLRMGNPVGAGLPVLEALLNKSTSAVYIPYVMGNKIKIEVNA